MTTNSTRWRQLAALLLVFCLSVTASMAQTPAQKQDISAKYNQSTLQQLQLQYKAQALDRKNEALRMAAQRGWDIIKTNGDGTFDELIAISPDGFPIYYTIYNDDAAISTRANHLNIGGSTGFNLDGQNMTAHVWDGGPTRVTHQEFDGPGGSNRVTINDGVFSLNGNSFHAQHVTGTIVASGVVARAKGMAPQAKALTHDWNNDLAEATTEAANGMLVSNHSYGYRASLVPDWYFGAYLAESRDWDNLLYNSPYYLMVVAAGNDGNDNSSNGAPLNGSSAFDKLTGHSTSKNNMVVANGQDANVASDGSLISVTINSGSSEGPTDDLRIKPDITGNGTGLYSTYDGSDTQYNSISGTSMASPNVAGTLLLLQQHYNNVNGSFMRSATLKGLAMHTADDAGISGPDAVYGWGLLNGKAAAEAISDNGNGSLIQELSLSQGQTYTISVDAAGTAPLLASISWTDPAGTANTGTANLSTPVLVNDLDIRVTQSSTTFSPYKLTGVNSNTTGDNVVDPFERVNINSASGAYTITVTHKGSLSSGSQDYTLIVTGVTGTPPVCNATTPTGLSSSGIGTTTASLSWNAVTGTTYDLRYRPTGSSTWTTQAISGTSASLTGLSADTQYEAQVRSKCPDNSTSGYSSSHTFSTNSTNCSGGITSFPYSESFENTLGSWSQATGDDLNWTIQTGGTPSSSTGPTGANDGSYYIYMEVSGDGTGFPNKRAILNSGCFDLSAASSATASFNYQMTGNAVGSVALEASADNGGTWASVWSANGDQGASWKAASVDLSAYTGATLLLRFNGLSGSSWQGDIALDNFGLSTGSTGGGGGCSGAVALPYADGFESDFGGWTNASGDDFNWSRQTGGTPSNNTGPASADAGSYYIYVESSSPNYATKVAIIESPCFAIPAGGADFSFRYHMFGAAAMGGLNLQASTDNGSSWTSVWSLSGNQGNSWQSASVDLAAYAGQSVQLRYVGTTGTTWQGDMALDNLSLTTGGGGGTQTTVSLSITFDNYPEETSWEINNGSSVLASGGTYPSQPDGSTIVETASLDAGCYNFVINDGYGDGICCSYGAGSYSLTDGGTTLASGGAFGSSETTSFCVGGATQSAYVTQTQSVGQPVSFGLYPVPVTGNTLTVVTNRENLNYTLTNVTGQVVDSGQLQHNEINVSRLEAGIYLLHIQDGHKTITRKVLKQ